MIAPVRICTDTHYPTHLLVRLLQPPCQRLRAKFKLPGLSDDVYPVEMRTNVYVSDKTADGTKVEAQMTQFPITNGVVKTAWKLQGQTIQIGLIIDGLDDFRKNALQAVYTLLSRLQSLDQLYLRRPLQAASCAGWSLPYDLEVELERLRNASKRTIQAFTTHVDIHQ
eukprot:gb/GECG01005651.1/.p1 GENE.gb/GECG01005651.1/~~gb/GECG01005651.1/.p1  ORF type:complete len:168 (+),score=7.11 gb/GECG01005651.1/:1-504(+)